MNSADSHIISGLLNDAGITEVVSCDYADAVILLTCSVRQHAEDRAAGFARTMKGEGKKVLIAGCMGQLRGKKLVEDGLADYVIGPDDYRSIPGLLMNGESTCGNSQDGLETYCDLLPHRTDPVSASLAVMRGCNNYCTYCVVPYARGPERSVPFQAVLDQVRFLALKGTREIFLLGQNVLAYQDGGRRFIDLLEQTATVSGVERVGFLTSHPRDLDSEMIDRMARIPQLLHFFHLPLQSGSNRILELMGRGYTLEEYEEKILHIRNVFPDAYVTTDILVGFPGETADDFAQTMEAVDRFEFDFAYMFAYSVRPGTKAARMTGQVPEKERKARLAVLIEKQNSITYEKARGLVGREEEVFVTAPAPRGEGAMIVELKNHRSVILKHTARPGERLKAKLVGIQGWSVLAEPVVKEVV
jgi:tRNA-2-methylthio-N6-dimethylallyladenosine synthase